MPSCVIVGAGLAGLTAAHRLKARGWRVVVVDKARRPGGRLATRRVGSALLDSGAQFFTARSDEFAAEVRSWTERGLVREWTRGFLDATLSAKSDGHPRFMALRGMNSIALALAEGLEIHTEAAVQKVTRSGVVWRVEAGAMVWEADALILTPPAPQSLALLEAEEVAPPVLSALQAIEYERCLALLVALRQPVALPPPGALQLPDAEPLRWLAEGQTKGTSPEPAFTLHASPSFSLSHWDSPIESVSEALLTAASGLVGPLDVAESYLHRWKFSRPTSQYPDRVAVARSSPALLFAGDAFGEPRVEGAFLSGIAAAGALA